MFSLVMQDRPNWDTPLVCCFAAAVCGAAIGGLFGAINSHVSWDCFAITLSWDGMPAPWQAIGRGVLEGAKSGCLFGVVLAIAAGASTRLRASPQFVLPLLGPAVVIILMCGLLAGAAATILARVWPRIWGFWLIGVPSRVNLPRFAWVAGSTAGLYAGWSVAIVVACVMLHRRWIRAAGPRHAFGVVQLSEGGE